MTGAEKFLECLSLKLNPALFMKEESVAREASANLTRYGTTLEIHCGPTNTLPVDRKLDRDWKNCCRYVINMLNMLKIRGAGAVPQELSVFFFSEGPGFSC